MMKKPVKVFRHNDLDGVGVGIVSKVFFGEENVHDVACDNHEVNAKVKDFIESGEYIFYSMVIVGDISFNEEVAETINSHSNLSSKFLLVDHHKTAEWLNKYPFAHVDVTRNGELASGTSSLMQILHERGFSVLPEYNENAVKAFVEKVRRYDTWEWHNVYDDQQANMLNQLYFLDGASRFEFSMLKKLSSDNLHRFYEGVWRELFSKGEIERLSIEEVNMRKYIDSRIAQAKVSSTEEFEFAYVFAERYTSQLGNKLCDVLGVDFAMVIDIQRGKVSLRSIGDKFDVSVLAKRYGGGGHKNSSGYSFNFNHDAFIESVFKQTKLQDEKQGIIQKLRNFVDNIIR